MQSSNFAKSNNFDDSGNNLTAVLFISPVRVQGGQTVHLLHTGEKEGRGGIGNTYL